MLRIVAIVFLSALTTLGNLQGQERYKDLVEEYYPQETEYTKPKPEYPQGVQVDAHEGDSLALVAFYNSTGGPTTWTDRTGWLQAPVYDWHGISLDGSGRVIVIELDDNKLSGALPLEIGQLAHLEHLDIGSDWLYGRFDGYNQIAGPIPKELGLLTNLKTLDLFKNKFSGSIPAELNSLLDLQTLDLGDNELAGIIPPELGLLESLRALDLRSNKLTGEIPRELGQLEKLEDLILAWNWLSGEIPLELAQLRVLRLLDLLGNQLNGGIPPELAQLGELRDLTLSGNDLSGAIPPELARLTRLEVLHLQALDLVGSIPPELGMLRQLKTLDLRYNNLEGEIPLELAQSDKLRFLSLQDNNLTGQIPQEFGELISLEYLHLNYNNLSGPIPPELGGLRSVRYLHLNHNDLSGAIPRELGQLVKLKELLLHNNGLSDALPVELGRLRNLQRLHLDNNDLSGELPNALGQLSNLQYLYLSNNYIADALPKEFGQLAELRILDLSNNNLSGPIPPELGNLDFLQSLQLQQNTLSGPIPPELGNLDLLQSLQLQQNTLSGPIPPELGNLDLLQSLQLQQNTLSGSIPPELLQLNSLQLLYLDNNQLSGALPDWSDFDNLRSVRVHANRYMFADLLPHAPLRQRIEFVYAPQDSIDTQLACSAYEYVFTTSATGDGNRYRWYRNGQPIPDARSDTLRLSTVSELDDYHAVVANGLLPSLTLFSRKASTRDAACTTQQYANIADSTLLVDFFNRTQGRFLWHNHSGWLEEPVAQWYGITLDASGRVTHVNLPRNNLVGQLPLSQLDQLPHLRHLDVSGNEFSGTIPKGLGALTQLEYLDLSHNTLAGELPKELAGQAPLKMLDVGDNQLVGAIPTELSQIATLQKLSVFWNQLSGPMPDFTGLDQLDSLDVSWNEFLFMDLLPNVSLTRLDDFVYAPQDSIETLLSRTASGFALTTAAKAMGNRYQWYRDDQPISGPQSDTLQVSATSDPAHYHVAITNDRLPELTLVSRKKGVHDGLTLTEADVPQDILLHQSYPNPFAEATTVAFKLGTPEHVRIVVYDLLGKVVATIADGRFTAGMHRVEFAGDHLASGQYMYRMEAGAYRATRFMSVIR